MRCNAKPGRTTSRKKPCRLRGAAAIVDCIRAKLKIGLIPDRPYLYEKLTAMEFLQFTAGLYNVGRQVFK
jgi:ABC-type multidrug transport system ATPase subunit